LSTVTTIGFSTIVCAANRAGSSDFLNREYVEWKGFVHPSCVLASTCSAMCGCDFAFLGGSLTADGAGSRKANTVSMVGSTS